MTDLAKLTAAAKQGDADAQYQRGLAFFKGEGVKRNYKKAEACYLEAAAQGHVYAQFALGWMYYASVYGVERDYKKAAHWFHEAAKRGDSDAQFILGWMFDGGHGGFPQDDEKAAAWYREAAKQGHANSQNMLSLIFPNQRVPGFVEKREARCPQR